MTDAGGGPPEAHPDSLLRRPDGSPLALKVHCCIWSGRFPGNSLDAVRECHRARVARAEVDLWLLADADGVIDHDGLVRLPGREPCRAGLVRRGELLDVPARDRPALLSEFVAAVEAESYPTRIEVDLKDEQPWPAARVAEIAALIAPVRERVILAGAVDETLRRLAMADGRISLGFNPELHLDWLPPERRRELAGSPGPDGWLNRTGQDRLTARLATLRSIAPTAVELHLRLETLERMVAEGADPIAQLHADGWFVDAWTLDAGTDGWEARFEAAVAAGVDMITTNTAAALARAYRERATG